MFLPLFTTRFSDHLGRQGSTQSTRLIREQVLKKESRQRKQMTQIASHRVDQMWVDWMLIRSRWMLISAPSRYYMQGSQSKLFLRHPVNTICSIQDQIRRKSLPPDLHRKTVIPTGCGNFDQRLIFITDTWSLRHLFSSMQIFSFFLPRSHRFSK